MTTAPSAHPDFQIEQEFLRHAYQCLSVMRDKRAAHGDAGGDPKASFALEELRRKMLERLEDPHSISFGRIDRDDGDRYYIGRQGIWDDKGDLVVINWSADVARPFYEATPDEPLGLALRRRFRTERERLLGISDETFGIGTAVEPTIADLLLEELGRERTAEMRDIAATIQRDQYRIISRPLGATTVVQGGPGTGKTAVGLHRAAFLLYRHREELVSTRVLVVGPNRLFMQYIAYVLPTLGETAADQVAVEALGSVTSTGPDDTLVARIKGDERMADVLRRALVDRVRPPGDDAQFKVSGVSFSVSASEIADLVKAYDARKQPYVVARDRFRSAFERRANEEYAAELRRKGSDTESRPINVRATPEFERALDRIWPSITGPELVRQLLASEERLERAAHGILTEPERRLLYRKPVERLDQVRWSMSDVSLVDEVQELIERSARRYGHVVLDEAQDLTPMQLRMVGRRIRDGSATVLGDLAQATGLWSYASWDAITSQLGIASTTDLVEELTLAYRVPREIMDIALPVLELTAPSIRPPEPFRDGGVDPIFMEVAHQARAGEAVDRAAAAHAGEGTAAIIAPTSLLAEVRSELERRGIAFGDAERGQLAATIELLDPIAAKGLEFDHVVLVEPAAIIREASEGQGHRELYVALTRAMRTLACLHSEPLPWPLGHRREPLERAEGPADVPLTQDEPVTGPLAVGEEAAAPSISVGEALVLARLRGIDVEEALARALLAKAAGGGESEAAAAILASSTDSDDAVAALLAKARTLAGGEHGGIDG